MKNFCITICILAIIILSLLILPINEGKNAKDCLRIHIYAASDEISDQKIKLSVRDAVVKYLTPKLASCKDKAAAKIVALESKKEIENLAISVLASNGFNYSAHAEVKTQVFPTRVYGGKEYAGGSYEALILTLGEGKGDNWWCVVYPPLCFIGEDTDNYYYRSKIAEIIESLFGSASAEKQGD